MKSVAWLVAAGYLTMNGDECDIAYLPTTSGMAVAPCGMRQLLWKGHLSQEMGIAADLVGTGFNPYSIVRE